MIEAGDEKSISLSDAERVIQELASVFFEANGKSSTGGSEPDNADHRQLPDVEARLRRDGLIAHIMSVEELSKYIDAETVRWRPVLDQLGLIGK